MLIQTFAQKVINNERKTLIHHEIIDRIAEQIKSVIIPVCKGSKLWINPVFHILIHLSSLTFIF